MQKQRAHLPTFRKLSGREMLVCAGIILLVVLIVVLCISINMRTHIQREYTAVRDKMGESLYSNLYMMIQTFDMVSVPNADVQNSILPQMEHYYIASTTINDLLTQTYGQKYAVLSSSDISSLNNAFTSYKTAFQEGSSTDLAYTDMQNCMSMLRELLTSRFSEGVLKAAR